LSFVDECIGVRAALLTINLDENLEALTMYKKDKDDFSFEIIEHLGTLSTSPKGWSRELNRVSWNGAKPKYDLRDWDETHTKMGKGIGLTEEELAKLKELLEQR
jgi:hypothetical protein